MQRCPTAYTRYLAGVSAGNLCVDFTRCEQKAGVVGQDARHLFVCAYAVGDFEAARDGVVVVDEVFFCDQGIDVEIDSLFAAMPVERIEGEFHPLPRRKREHVFGYIVPDAADRFPGDQQDVDGLASAEFQGDLILPTELLSRVVQEAKQVRGTDAGMHDRSEIEAEQRAVLAPEVAVDLLVSIPEKSAAAIIRMPSAEHGGQWQTRRAPAHDDDGMVFGCGHEISLNLRRSAWGSEIRSPYTRMRRSGGSPAVRKFPGSDRSAAWKGRT